MDIIYENHSESSFYLFKRLGRYFHMHRHSQHEIIYITKGTLKCVIGGNKYSVDKDSIVIIPKNYIHEYLDSDDTEYHILVINIPQIENIRLITPIITKDNDMINSFKLIIKESENNDSYYTEMIRYIIGYFSVLVLRKYSQHFSTTVSHNNLIDDVFDYIEQNIYEKLSIEMLAEKFGYSPKYFSKLFKERAGINFKEYLNFKRIDTSKTLLTASNTNISSIAEKCGFSNIHEFNRNFKKHTGMTPSQFRKN